MMKALHEAVQELLEQTGIPCARMEKPLPIAGFPYLCWRNEMLDHHSGMITAVARYRDDDTACLDLMARMTQLVPENGLLLHRGGFMLWLWREGCGWERSTHDLRVTEATVRFGCVCYREVAEHAV